VRKQNAIFGPLQILVDRATSDGRDCGRSAVAPIPAHISISELPWFYAWTISFLPNLILPWRSACRGVVQRTPSTSGGKRSGTKMVTLPTAGPCPLQCGIVTGFKSERWPGSARNGGQHRADSPGVKAVRRPHSAYDNAGYQKQISGRTAKTGPRT